MRTPLRIVYRAILRLHPYAFRAEFGDEMLWIFDQELREEDLQDEQLRNEGSRRSNAAVLLLDGLRSLFVQNIRPRLQEAETAGPYYVEIDSSLPSERFAQAWLVTICGTLCISLFMSMVAPKVAAPISGLLFSHIKLFSSAPHAKVQP